MQRYQGNGSKFLVEIKTHTITTQQQQQQQQKESYFKEGKELKIRPLGTRMGRDRTEN